MEEDTGGVEIPTQSQRRAGRFMYWLGGSWSAFAASYITAITFFDVPKENVRFADTVLGFLLGTVVTSVLNFYFGSSKSAHNQEEILIATAKNGELK